LRSSFLELAAAAAISKYCQNFTEGSNEYISAFFKIYSDTNNALDKLL